MTVQSYTIFILFDVSHFGRNGLCSACNVLGGCLASVTCMKGLQAYGLKRINQLDYRTLF